jgi:SAM-dependent methyltransferase
MRIDGAYYEDWLSTNEEAGTWWLNEGVPIEASGSQHMIEDYLIPLLGRLGFSRGATVLSVGCGGGWDVATLQRQGFPAWGIDNGGRVRAWKVNPYRDYLSISDALRLPFPDNAFDLVFSEGVIEHIGYAGDSADKLPDFHEKRKQFVRSLMRVTKPGGYVFISCPNRLFPIDFFHGGRTAINVRGLNLRLHSPFEEFLLSYKDIRSLVLPHVQWMRPLTLKNFFNLSRLARASGPLGPIIRLIAAGTAVVPDRLWSTAISPYLAILVKK